MLMNMISQCTLVLYNAVSWNPIITSFASVGLDNENHDYTVGVIRKFGKFYYHCRLKVLLLKLIIQSVF